jgi:cell division protein FtsB
VRLTGWIVGALVILLVFGNQGFRKLVETFRESRRLEKTLVALRAEHERLARELTWIQKDPSYIEFLIRKNLGFVKKGEIEYRLLRKEKPSK